MRHLLAVLDGGMDGTRPEPSQGSLAHPVKVDAGQQIVAAGTRGTCGTLADDCVVSAADFETSLTLYAERLGNCLEDGNIDQGEIGAEFLRRFDSCGKIASRLAHVL